MKLIFCWYSLQILLFAKQLEQQMLWFCKLVILYTQDNTKLFQQLKSGFKHTTNWNKYQSKTSTQAEN